MTDLEFINELQEKVNTVFDGLREDAGQAILSLDALLDAVDPYDQMSRAVILLDEAGREVSSLAASVKKTESWVGFGENPLLRIYYQIETAKDWIEEINLDDDDGIGCSWEADGIMSAALELLEGKLEEVKEKPHMDKSGRLRYCL